MTQPQPNPGLIETPFHTGELQAQRRVGVVPTGAAIRRYMPQQHRDFFGLLRYLPIASRNEAGAPVATILTGPPGFVASPTPTTLGIAALPDPHDFDEGAFRTGAPVGVLGIDLSTRRRNRANGSIAAIGADGLTVAVTESFGNCPQYIQARDVEPVPTEIGAIERLGSLDPEARGLIAGADTFFVASTGGNDAGVDLSHRGGRPGFLRLVGDTLMVPDFKGNRYFNALGNFLQDPRAALLFVDFVSGDLLHLTGEVEVRWDAKDALAGAERIWLLRISGAWRRRRALVLRWVFRAYAPTTERTGVWAGDVEDMPEIT